MIFSNPSKVIKSTLWKRNTKHTERERDLNSEITSQQPKSWERLLTRAVESPAKNETQKDRIPMPYYECFKATVHPFQFVLTKVSQATTRF